MARFVAVCGPWPTSRSRFTRLVERAGTLGQSGRRPNSAAPWRARPHSRGGRRRGSGKSEGSKWIRSVNAVSAPQSRTSEYGSLSGEKSEVLGGSGVRFREGRGRMGRPATDTSCRSEVGQRQSAEEQARGYRLKLRHAAALALVGWYVMLPPQTRAQPSTLTIRPALLPVPNVMNVGADPARFRPAPLNVVLHQYISLPGWVKAKSSMTCASG
jgi:hypothetical protein